MEYLQWYNNKCSKMTMHNVKKYLDIKEIFEYLMKIVTGAKR